VYFFEVFEGCLGFYLVFLGLFDVFFIAIWGFF
jgi:hypothetical protein